MEEISVPILFFAKARELVGKSSSSLPVFQSSNITWNELLVLILEKFPQLNNISKNLVLAINQQYIDPQQVLELDRNSEIAVIPPLSGG